jgi:Ca2+-binding EF-hand superfamily protein
MGLLGLESGSFLSDRIFDVMDMDRDGDLSMDDFLKYFDVLIYGSDAEKAEITFKMIDIDGNGTFDRHEFSKLIYTILQCWNNITGSQQNITNNPKLKLFIDDVFSRFDLYKDGQVTLESFKKVVAAEPKLLEIFDYLNKGISDTLNPFSETDTRDKRMAEEIEELEKNLNAIKKYLEGGNEEELLIASKQTERFSMRNSAELNSPVIKNLDNITRSIFFKPIRESMIMENTNSALPNKRNRRQSTPDLLKSREVLLAKDTLGHQLDIAMGPPTLDSATLRSREVEIETQRNEEKTIMISKLLPDSQVFQTLMNQINLNKYSANPPLFHHKTVMKKIAQKNFAEEDIDEDMEVRLNNVELEFKLHDIPEITSNNEFKSDNLNFPMSNGMVNCPSMNGIIYEADSVLSNEAPINSTKDRDHTTKPPRPYDIITTNKVYPRTSQKPQKNATFQETDVESVKIKKVSGRIDELISMTKRLGEEVKYKEKKSEALKEEEKQLEYMRDITAVNVPRPRKSGAYVFFGHQNWNLVLNMMLGIQMAVRSVIDNHNDQLTSKDFKLKYYFELVPRRTHDDKNAFKICKFFDYAPSVFCEIRKLYGIKNEEYLRSIGPETMLNNLIKGAIRSLAELTSTGKSGSFFYFSADGKYTLKTIPREEFHFLRDILRNYYEHLTSNPNTLIIKFYGLHKIRFEKSRGTQKKVYFTIMANVFHTHREIHLRYDLKGSTYGRSTPDEDPSVAKKDLNIIKTGDKLVLTKPFAEFFLSQITKDCKFFEANNIIDYSLLIGMHNLGSDVVEKTHVPLSIESSGHKKYFEEKFNHREGLMSADGRFIYFIGIIDILTQFNSRKKMEYVVKRVAYGKGISAVPPKQYSERFQKFMASIIQVT